jgi:hypothetical protein
MGGKGSSRWRDHEKAPLIEEAICIDLITLRRAGLLDHPGIPHSITWTPGSSDTPAAEGWMSLEIGPGGARWLVAVIVLFGNPNPLCHRRQPLSPWGDE